MEKFQKKGFLIHNRIEKREKRWEVVRSDNMELRVRGYCSWIVYLREKWWKIQMVIENRSQETANSFLRRTKRMGRKKKEREKERNEEREREKKKRERNETEWTELLKISVAWKTVLEVGTSDLLPRMYNWSNFLKSYRSFKYNRVREI